MTVQIIISKEVDNCSADQLSKYLDETVLSYLHRFGWIVDNISTI